MLSNFAVRGQKQKPALVVGTLVSLVIVVWDTTTVVTVGVATNPAWSHKRDVKSPGKKLQRSEMPHGTNPLCPPESTKKR